MKMKTIVFAVLLFVSSFALSEVLVVNIWESMPGHGNLTLQYAQEARGIHQKAGARVVVANDQMGNLHYVMGFDSWVAYAGFQGKMQGNEAWAAFSDKINKKPSATLAENYMMNVAVPGELGAIMEVFIWEPMPGRLAETLEAGTRAKAIHEKAGAKVSINVDRLNRLHYVMAFDSLEAWGKLQDTPNEEFARFSDEFNEDPPAKLVKVYAVNQVP